MKLKTFNYTKHIAKEKWQRAKILEKVWMRMKT